MQVTQNIQQPMNLPFLKAICWELGDVCVLNLDEMLNRYERGWEYRGVLADVKGEEKNFIRKLAKTKGSWLQLDV